MIYLVALVFRWVRLDTTPAPWRRRRRRQPVDVRGAAGNTRGRGGRDGAGRRPAARAVARGQPPQWDRGLLASVRGAGRGRRVRARGVGDLRRVHPAGARRGLRGRARGRGAGAALSRGPVLRPRARRVGADVGGPGPGADPSQSRGAARAGGRRDRRTLVVPAGGSRCCHDRHAVGGRTVRDEPRPGGRDPGDRGRRRPDRTGARRRAATDAGVGAGGVPQRRGPPAGPAHCSQPADPRAPHRLDPTRLRAEGPAGATSPSRC